MERLTKIGRKSPEIVSYPRNEESLIDGIYLYIHTYLDKLWSSNAYYALILAVSSVFLFAEASRAGMFVLLILLIFLQSFSSDLLIGLLPISCFLLLGTDSFEDIASFLTWWWMIPLILFSFVINLRWNGVRLTRGAGFHCLSLVSLATVFGGIGYISIPEYFSGVSLFYVLGLGPMLALVSCLYYSSLSAVSYDLADRFSKVLYSTGLFAGIVLVHYYMANASQLVPGYLTLYIHFRNYLTVLLLVAFPMPFRFMKKGHAGLHLTAAVFLYAALLFTGSRTALVFGSIMVAVCFCWMVSSYLKLDRKKILSFSLVCLLCSLAGIYVLGHLVLGNRLVDGSLFPASDSRLLWLKQSLLDFMESPLVGIGLGNMKNQNIFIGVGGSIPWYHNYFAQIIGSMGLLGIVAYSFLLRFRAGVLKRLCRSGEIALVLSYAGMFMASLTNPGEFCPFPNAYFMVVLFEVSSLATDVSAHRAMPEDLYIHHPPKRRLSSAAISTHVRTDP